MLRSPQATAASIEAASTRRGNISAYPAKTTATANGFPA